MVSHLPPPCALKAFNKCLLLSCISSLSYGQPHPPCVQLHLPFAQPTSSVFRDRRSCPLCVAIADITHAQGAGASVPETIPATKEEALKAGYTEEQITAYTTEMEGGARAIQKAAKNKNDRAAAKDKVEEQKAVNAIGSKIALEVPMEVQKKLHSPQFTEDCAAIFKASDADGSNTLIATELVNAMNAVRSKMELAGDAITPEQAQHALTDFDIDHNATLDHGEFTKLSKILIVSTLICDADIKPRDVAKYSLASEGYFSKEGGMPSKPPALEPIGKGKLPPLKLAPMPSALPPL